MGGRGVFVLISSVLEPQGRKTEKETRVFHTTCTVPSIKICVPRNHCWGSVTFWCGSGSGSGSPDPHLWLMDPDSAPDPAHFSDTTPLDGAHLHFNPILGSCLSRYLYLWWQQPSHDRCKLKGDVFICFSRHRSKHRVHTVERQALQKPPPTPLLPSTKQGNFFYLAPLLSIAGHRA